VVVVFFFVLEGDRIMGGIEYTGDRILLRLSIVYGVDALQVCSPQVFSQEK
jgi:hypothetical protein